MVLDAVSNFVRGTADAAIASGDTTISVADAGIFPNPATDGEFNVVIWNANNFPRPDQDANVEIVRVTTRDTSTDELTVTRAQEMTSAAAHPDGSAIHLSPTAKMFSDIEGTFADFWDAGAQELTADVNNTNTRTETLEAEDLRSPPTGGVYQLDGNQTLPNGVLTDIAWAQTNDEFGEINGLLNASDNKIVVPEGYGFAKVSIKLQFSGGDEPNEIEVCRSLLNGNNFPGGAGTSSWDSLESFGRYVEIVSDWFRVGENDEIGADIRVLRDDEGDSTLQDRIETTMGVWLR